MLPGTLEEYTRHQDERPSEVVNLCIIHSFVQQTFTERREPSPLPSAGDGQKSEPPSSPATLGCADKQAVRKLLSSGQGLGEARESGRCAPCQGGFLEEARTVKT